MSIFKGEWKARQESKYESTQEIMCGNFCIANVWPGTVDRREDECIANANIIVTAVNECQRVNPDNPQAVAESINDMYEALKKAQKVIECECYPLLIERMNKALAKAEGRE